MRKELYILILLIILCLVVKSPSTMDDTQTIRHIIWAVFTLVLFVMITLKERIRFCGIYIAFGVYIVFSILSLAKAICFTEGLYEVLRIFLMMTFIYVSARAIRENKKLFFKAMVLISLGVGIYGIYAYFTTPLHGLIGLMSNRNSWAAANLLLLPFCLRKPKKIALLAASLLIFNVVTLCARSTWVAFVFASVVTIISFRLIPKPKYIIAITAAMIISLIVANYQVHFIRRAISTTSIQVRWQKWSRTFKMIRDNPFLGVGIAGWPVSVTEYGNSYIRDEYGAHESFFLRNHNDFQERYSEVGIIGGTAYLSIFMTGLWYSYKKRYASMFFGILCYMGFAFFSFPAERAFSSMILLLMIAVVLPCGKVLGDKKHLSRIDYSSKGDRLSLFVSMFLTVILCCSILDFYARYKSEVSTKIMLIAKEHKNWQHVVNIIDDGHSRFAQYDNMLYTPIISYRAEAYINMNNVVQSLEDYKKAIKLHPHHTYIMANLGSCYHLVGDRKKAKHYYEQSLEVTPGFKPALANLEEMTNKKGKLL